MQKLILLFLVSISITTLTNGQRVKVSWGEEQKQTYGSSYLFTKGKGSEILQVRTETKVMGLFSKTIPKPTITVARFGKNFQLLTEKELKDAEGVGELVGAEDHFYLFHVSYNSKNKTSSLGCQSYNSETLEKIGNYLELGTFENGESRYKKQPFSREILTELASQPVFNFRHSSDSSKTLVMISPQEETLGNEKYHFSVLDKSMNKLWDKNVELPFLSQAVDIESSFITNDGRVCLLLKIYNNEKKEEEIKINGEMVLGYKTRLLIYGSNNNAPFEYDLKANGKLVHSAKITGENSGNLTLAGLYMSIPNSTINGYFTVKIPLQPNPGVEEKIMPFSPDLISRVSSDGQGTGAGENAGISGSFSITKILKEDGGAIHCLLEYHKKDISNSREVFNGSMRNFSTSYYMKGDIIDIRLNNNNEAKITRIPKFRNDQEFALSVGFEAMMYNDKLVIIYMDKEKNLALKPTDTAPTNRLPNNGKDEALILTVLENDGSFTRSIIRNNDQDFMPSVSGATRLDKNRFIYMGVSSQGFSKEKVKPGIMEIL